MTAHNISLAGAAAVLAVTCGTGGAPGIRSWEGCGGPMSVPDDSDVAGRTAPGECPVSRRSPISGIVRWFSGEINST